MLVFPFDMSLSLSLCSLAIFCGFVNLVVPLIAAIGFGMPVLTAGIFVCGV